uniref:Phospholipid phosphatase 1 n=1 Tax=Takifugu rubripes TaxID=31033 RepID=A0A674MP08_TAKRU
MFEASGFALVLLDFTCLILVGLPFFVLTPQHNPFKRGFFCNDESIRYPLREDTISYQLLGGVMIPFVLVVVICGECLSVHMSNVSNQSSGAKYLVCVYKAVGSFVFGAAVSQSLTDVAKYSIGRLRPNFLAVCKPVWEHVNCGTGGYTENFTYFPSSPDTHPSPCTLYIQARLRSEWARLLRPTIQFFLIATAVYVGLSRVSDYKHHWSDVLAGLLVWVIRSRKTLIPPSKSSKTVALQDKQETHANLQENPTNGITYGSMD